MKYPQKENLILNIIIFILLFIILILLPRFFSLRDSYLKIIDNSKISQVSAGVKFDIYPKDGLGYKMVIGDIIGIDKKAFDFVESINDEKGESLIKISGIKKDFREITRKNFISIVSNDNNVFIPENFCRKKWEDAKGENLLYDAVLNKGPFCNSEDETRLIDLLIKQYNPSEILIYYSTSTYLELISGFLEYLDNLEIPYSLIEVK